MYGKKKIKRRKNVSKKYQSNKKERKVEVEDEVTQVMRNKENVVKNWQKR